ncbi:squalene synthetase-like protein [Linnemannia zychae]|nr:squalene synthetase-like protein [Linnemannia zychae]
MVAKEAEEAKAHTLENNIHEMIEGMHPVIEAVEKGVVAVEGEPLVVRIDPMGLNPKMDISHSLQIQMSKGSQRGRSDQGSRGRPHPRFGSREEGNTRRRGPTAIAFNKATRLTNPDVIEGSDDDDDDLVDYDEGWNDSGSSEDGVGSDYDEDDDGEIGNPDEDEIDESEDQFIMQRFDWEEDQDPELELKRARARAAEAAAAAAREVESFVPPSRWGGALSYQSMQRKNENSEDKDDYEEARRLVRKALSKSIDNMVQETVVKNSPKDASQTNKEGVERMKTSKIKASTTTMDHKTTTVISSTAAVQYNVRPYKELSDTVDRTKDISSANADENTNEFFVIDLTGGEENASAPAKSEIAIEKAENTEAETEPDLQMLWVIDTKPSEVVFDEEPKPQIPETYVYLPPEPEFTGRPAKKTHRSKRGGRRVREEMQEQKRIKTTTQVEDDGHIALEEAESEEDDDMLALEDYFQNTTDPDNPDYLDSFLGSLTSLNSGFGHSSGVHDGLDLDDSDFEEEASEDDSQDDEDFDFTNKSAEKRRKRKADELLSSALDTAFDSEWPAGAPQGYGFYEPEEFVGRYGRRPRGDTAISVPYRNHLEALTSINDNIKDFVNDRTKVSLELPPLAKALRRRVHLLSELYNLRSQSVGSGKNRFPVLMRTEKTKLPHTPIDLRRFMNAGMPLPRIQEGFDGRRDRSNNRRGDRYRRRVGLQDGDYRMSAKDPRDSARAVAGSVVGGTASEISKDNVGHRMLSKMGWSPGVGLGASGDGITKPIEAVIRARRRGLGHE